MALSTPDGGSTRDDVTGPGSPGAADPLREAADVMRAVRDRCVWTQQIDHRALVPYLVEESAELIDAVEDGSRDELREELGDLLWQVLFHSEIASRDEEDPFDIDDVARRLTDKMVRRHPHVFGDAVATTPEEVLVHWSAAKAAEKHQRRSVLDGVSERMPSLALAQKLLSKGAQVNIDPAPATAASPNQGTPAETGGDVPGLGADPLSRRGAGTEPAPDPATEAELGDALLALVATARANGWDAERALRERLRRLERDIRAAESPQPVPESGDEAKSGPTTAESA
ncbi:MazG family protein [Microbacterium sp. NPDC056044]|uniref:MazG family protein n=1 Tax=Microbacterium sp. NPDC056044 TaxID=3345690 RepID=UPI0035E30E66